MICVKLQLRENHKKNSPFTPGQHEASREGLLSGVALGHNVISQPLPVILGTDKALISRSHILSLSTGQGVVTLSRRSWMDWLVVME
ncbi:hypothetical protein C8N31_113109 [Sulfitobacter mediterraneus]|uniref:Uncharacterized protein n=1 Tax=Sulfitobacter mediterraneus TaxID=83219 RepID=A0A2T6CAD3_9RHOB|nr:hypothetical protein C8N31_113109 [Sulfitobacter mediterraneus]